MKKILFAIFVFFIGITVVKAESYIYLFTGDARDPEIVAYIYSDTEQVSSYPGLSYNGSTNTLTLNNFHYPDGYTISGISIKNMGDLKINVVGTNDFRYESVYNRSAILVEDTNLDISGGGTLNFMGPGINGNRKSDGVNTINISNVTMNCYDIQGICALAIVRGASINLDGVTANFAGVVPDQSGGFAAKNITVNDSNIVGMGHEALLSLNGSISITNSDIKLFFNTGISSDGNLYINNSTIYNDSFSIGEDYGMNQYISNDVKTIFNNNAAYLNYANPEAINLTSGMSADGDITLIDSSLDLTVAGGVQLTGNLTLTNSDLKVKSYHGVITIKNIVINSGSLESIDAITAITADKITINAGKVKGAIMDDTMRQSFGSQNFYAIQTNSFSLAQTHLMFLDDVDYRDIDVSNGLNANRLFEAYPEHEPDPVVDPAEDSNNIIDVIKKVPKTGISAFVSIILGIQLLLLGGYFIYNKTKKETL